MDLEKYERDGEIGVIVSHGFGAGWSTLAYENSEFFAMDRGLVELKMRGADEDEVTRYIEGRGIERPYMGGWREATVEFVPKGSSFKIEEYDGSETLTLLGNLGLMVA